MTPAAQPTDGADSCRDVDVAAVARLLGDRARVAILHALLAGRALTAGELAGVAGLSRPAISNHLAQLVDGGLITVIASGRHRYAQLAGPAVATALEALAMISPPAPVRSLSMNSAARALRPARLCYDHVAGELGVQIHDALLAAGGFALTGDGLHLTAAGRRWLARAGVDVESLGHSRRAELRTCLDWTERRFHLAGAAPAALATAMLDQQWIERRRPGERGLTITPTGRRRLDALLAVPTDSIDPT